MSDCRSTTLRMRSAPRPRREETLKETAAANNSTILKSTLAQVAGLYAVSQARARRKRAAPSSLTPGVLAGLPPFYLRAAKMPRHNRLPAAQA